MLYRMVSDAQYRCHKHSCLCGEPLLEPCFEAAGVCFPIDPGHPQAHANDAILLHPGSCQGSWAVAHGVLNPCRTRAMQSRTSVATPYSAICMKEYSRGACTCDGSLQGAQSSILANAVPTGRSTVFLKPQSSHCARAAIAVPALPVGSSSCRAAQELLCLSIQDDTVRF